MKLTKIVLSICMRTSSKLSILTTSYCMVIFFNVGCVKEDASPNDVPRDEMTTLANISLKTEEECRNYFGPTPAGKKIYYWLLAEGSEKKWRIKKIEGYQRSRYKSEDAPLSYYGFSLDVKQSGSVYDESTYRLKEVCSDLKRPQSIWFNFNMATGIEPGGMISHSLIGKVSYSEAQASVDFKSEIKHTPRYGLLGKPEDRQLLYVTPLSDSEMEAWVEVKSESNIQFDYHILRLTYAKTDEDYQNLHDTALNFARDIVDGLGYQYDSKMAQAFTDKVTRLGLQKGARYLNVFRSAFAWAKADHYPGYSLQFETKEAKDFADSVARQYNPWASFEDFRSAFNKGSYKEAIEYAGLNESGEFPPGYEECRRTRRITKKLEEVLYRPCQQFSAQDLQSLTSLDLSKSGLSHLEPDDLRGLINLKILNMKENYVIRTIREPLFKEMKNLEQLDMSNNGLRNISEKTFEGLPSLKTLNLSKNAIQVIPASGFSQLSMLEVLNLEKNPIEEIDISAFDNLNSIQQILFWDSKLAQKDQDTLVKRFGNKVSIGLISEK